MKTKKYLPSYQIGLKWLNDDGEECVTVPPRLHKSGKRMASLRESNFIGAIGGMHYYARIAVCYPSWSVNGDRGGHGGYGGKNQPRLESISLEAERRLTKVEKDMNGDPIGKIGEMTRRFNLPEEAKAAAVLLFKKSFAPGWVLVPEYIPDGEDEYPVLAET